ncbi:hypothetical protein EYF80_033661 [Liparis tanakae]|uniref:Uncharacterized protein n=1 Tax=Liparis tanakae TaxID=230148 RepID=A0A4Z2GS32_9TELE|nr:hypothetical protein EYF80_033661 [Liparis tanakae]
MRRTASGGPQDHRKPSISTHHTLPIGFLLPVQQGNTEGVAADVTASLPTRRVHIPKGKKVDRERSRS